MRGACYLRYRWFPRRTLLGSSVIKPASLRPGTGSAYQGRRVSAKYYLFLVCEHIAYTLLMRGVPLLTAIGYGGVGMASRRRGRVVRYKCLCESLRIAS